MLDNKLLQRILDAITGIPTVHGDLNSTVYLQQIRDAILGVTPAEVRGNLHEKIYLQQIRNAIRGVPDGAFGSLSNEIYLQQIMNAYNGVADGQYGSLSSNTYLGIIAGIAAPSAEVYEVPSYANVGGTGNRVATIIVTTSLTVTTGPVSKMVDGDTVTLDMFFSGAVLGSYLRFAFGAKKLITEARIYGFFEDWSNWQAQGSNDGAVWSNIGAVVNILNPNPQLLVQLAGNTTGYSYYQWVKTTPGNFPAGSVFAKEMEFKIGSLLSP